MNPESNVEVSGDMQALLNELRDIAEPAAPGSWPPAIGWWVLAVFGLAAICALTLLFTEHQIARRKNKWRRDALTELRSIRDSGGLNRLVDLSILMRRVALAVRPRLKVAALTDAEWLSSLDSIGATTDYTDGIGRLLARAPYQRDGGSDNSSQVDQLFELSEATIKLANPNNFESQYIEPGPIKDGQFKADHA